ncbi:hypothetical protein O1W71_14780 [Microbacterium sp. H37-C3]|jgi:hypothetical protein|uniref:hypothetical protein n=1 Tax=Microbacterium sp. H37-C3 TaxID=3004354 RepID=UPI0022AFE7C7|nr:hypothetical protein [Microbacterium sp. H37-C3]MCZ4068941.1 hypothetical protein [Microbacterium sp. H37-C3]
MARQTISWTQGVRFTATVDVDESELTRWASGAVHVRTIDGEVTRSAGSEDVSRMLGSNQHLRAALLQSWVAEKAQEQQ